MIPKLDFLNSYQISLVKNCYQFHEVIEKKPYQSQFTKVIFLFGCRDCVSYIFFLISFESILSYKYSIMNIFKHTASLKDVYSDHLYLFYLNFINDAAVSVLAFTTHLYIFSSTQQLYFDVFQSRLYKLRYFLPYIKHMYQ